MQSTVERLQERQAFSASASPLNPPTKSVMATARFLEDSDENLMSGFEELKIEEKLFKVKKVNDDELWFDRDPRHFRPVLNYLRTGELVREAGISLEGIIQEARYFQVRALIEQVIRENEELKAGDRETITTSYLD